jgi:NAD(P)H-hydrate epimerase
MRTSVRIHTRIYNGAMRANRQMTSLYTAEQVRRIDRDAIERIGIAGFELMQRAAVAAFALLRQRWPEARHLALLAGNGNNGGDAFLLGVLARQAGFRVDAFALAGEPGGDALRARLAFVAAGGRVADAGALGEIPAADVWVDGLFGTGLTRPVQGAAAAVIEKLNASRQPVLALDVPSGLDADSGCRLGSAVRADATISFVAWKRGQFTADGADCCGARTLATLDLPDAAYADLVADAELLTDSIGYRLAPRCANVNKSSFGHVIALGGDVGMGGAIRLSGEAALRCGAGLVSVATRTENVLALNAARAELMAHGVADAGDLAPLLERASVVAIGPGMGQGAWGRLLFEAGLACGKPAVIDADALNLLARAPRKLAPDSVLTPHPGEAARLLGCDTAAVQRDRYAAVRKLAVNHAAVVVLKGAGSLIADPQGRVAVCPWGNPGMASGGMGDLLTGVVAALLSQGLSAWDAARLGVALHARAGDQAAGDAPRGLIASDLLAPLRQLANRFAP